MGLEKTSVEMSAVRSVTELSWEPKLRLDVQSVIASIQTGKGNPAGLGWIDCPRTQLKAYHYNPRNRRMLWQALWELDCPRDMGSVYFRIVRFYLDLVKLVQKFEKDSGLVYF